MYLSYTPWEIIGQQYQQNQLLFQIFKKTVLYCLLLFIDQVEYAEISVLRTRSQSLTPIQHQDPRITIIDLEREWKRVFCSWDLPLKGTSSSFIHISFVFSMFNGSYQQNIYNTNSMIIWLWVWIVQASSLRVDGFYNTGAGVIQLSSLSTSSSYGVTFTKKYKNIPLIAIAFNTIQNSPASRNQFIDLTVSSLQLITLTSFTFQAMQDTTKGVDPNMIIKISYLVADPNPDLNILELSLDSTNNGLTDFPSGIDIYSDTIFGCYLERIWCARFSNNSNMNIISYSAQYKDLNTATFSLNVQLQVESSCADYYLQIFVVIVNVPPPNSLSTAAYRFYNKGSGFRIIPDISKTTTYFIGLGFFNGNSAEFHAGVTIQGSNVQVHTAQQQVSYRQIMFTYTRSVTLKKLHINHHHKTQTFQFDLEDLTFRNPPMELSPRLINFGLSAPNSPLVTADLMAPFQEGTDLQIQVNFKDSTNTPLTVKIYFPVFNIIQVDVNPMLSTISILMVNIQQSITANDLIFDQTKFSVISFDPAGVDRYRLQVRIHASALQGFIQISYKKPEEDFLIRNYFKLTTITEIRQSAASKSVDVQIVDWTFPGSSNQNYFGWKSPNLPYSFSPWDADGALCTFSYTDQLASFGLSYTRYHNNNFVQDIAFTLIQVRAGKVLHGQNIAEIEICNLEAIDKVAPSDFSIPTVGAPAIQSVERRDAKVFILVDISNYADLSQFQIVFAPLHSSMKTVYEKIKLIKNLFKQTVVNREEVNVLKFVLHNAEPLSADFPLRVSADLPELTVQTVEITQDEIIVNCTYQADMSNKKVVLSYDTDEENSNTFYENQVEFNIESKYPLVFCANYDQLLPRNKLVSMVSMALSALYLLVFAFSVFCSNKMYGLELMYTIQLGCYTLAPLNIFCPPFEGLSGLKYSVPLLPLFDTLFEQVALPANYLSMGINSNFLSNVNLGLTPLFVLLLLYLPMTQIGKRSEDMHTKPRCLKYGKSMLFELPLTVLLFNSFNIYSSAVVSIQSFGFSNLSVVLPAILTSLLLPGMAFIFYKFGESFVEFRKEFNCVDRSWLFEKGRSVTIRRTYPLVMMAQFIVVPLILAIESLFKYSLFMVLAIETCVTAFVAIVPLYQMRTQNVRNYVHRAITVGICAFQILALSLRQPSSTNSPLIGWLPFGLISLLVLGLLCTGSFVVYKSVRFIRSPKLIDTELLIKNSPNKKPKHQLTETSEFIPKSEFVFKDAQKQQRSHTLVQSDRKPDTKYLMPDDKIQLWFDEIGSKNYFSQLGLSKDSYQQLIKNRISYIEREWFVRRCLNGIRIDDLLINFSTDIFTLGDLMDRVGPTVVRELRERNAKNQQLFKLEDDGI